MGATGHLPWVVRSHPRELHGGTALIEDGEHGGARFVITLPGDITELPSDARRLQAV